MTTYKPLTASQKEDLRLHALWLHNDPKVVRLDWSYRDLRGANLQGANLHRADLRGVCLWGACLEGANLKRANMEGADMRGADMRGADMRGANMRGANMRGANMRGANMDYQIQEGLLLQVAMAALATEGSLNMRAWHTYDTTHCIAGWACHLNPVAENLEETHGTEVAALLTLGQEAHSHFFDSNRGAAKYLQSVVKESK